MTAAGQSNCRCCDGDGVLWDDAGQFTCPCVERAAIVAWLRKAEVQHLGIDFASADKCADAIERGEHHER